MDHDAALTAGFEAVRPHLRAVAFRMLGSLPDADDAVQQTWLKARRADRRGVQNLAGWLTTAVGRECLDRLRARRRRGEVGLPDHRALDGVAAAAPDVADEVVLAEEVGRALLVVLDRLGPAERVALVLHDLFAVPFEQVGAVVDRSPDAAKKLASRARGKVRGGPVHPAARVAEQRRLASAFLAAARDGDIAGLLAVLAPDVVRRADPAVLPPGVPAAIRGVDEVVPEIRLLGRRAAGAEPALVDGAVGVVVAPRGRLELVLVLGFTGDRIGAFEVVADPDRLGRRSIAALDPPGVRW